LLEELKGNSAKIWLKLARSADTVAFPTTPDEDTGTMAEARRSQVRNVLKDRFFGPCDLLSS